ncbi:hypothetical protein [Lacunisphaera limnophila]|nr:hypothetical protein [Lacunisphaera limnophila]
MHPPAPLSAALPPLLATAVLLLATASSWRARRVWVESVGLAAGVAGLALALAGLPRPVSASLLPSASLLLIWVVFAASEWRFAPDLGQTGFSWTFQAALRPTLGTGIGATPGFLALLFWHDNPWLPLLQPLALVSGLLAAHRLDLAFHQLTCSTPVRRPSDDDESDGPNLPLPENTHV